MMYPDDDGGVTYKERLVMLLNCLDGMTIDEALAMLDLASTAIGQSRFDSATVNVDDVDIEYLEIEIDEGEED